MAPSQAAGERSALGPSSFSRYLNASSRYPQRPALKRPKPLMSQRPGPNPKEVRSPMRSNFNLNVFVFLTIALRPSNIWMSNLP
jgi:hypothetical protein